MAPTATMIPVVIEIAKVFLLSGPCLGIMYKAVLVWGWQLQKANYESRQVSCMLQNRRQSSRRNSLHGKLLSKDHASLLARSMTLRLNVHSVLAREQGKGLHGLR